MINWIFKIKTINFRGAKMSHI